MKLTRRQFGIAILGGMFMVLFGRFLSIFKSDSPHVGVRHVAARYWTAGDHLAG